MNLICTWSLKYRAWNGRVIKPFGPPVCWCNSRYHVFPLHVSCNGSISSLDAVLMLYFLFLIYFFVLLPFLLNSSVSPFPVLGQLWTSQHLTGDIHVEQLAFWILRISLRVQEIYGNLYAAGRVCRTINYIWVHSQVCIVVFLPWHTWHAHRNFLSPC